MVSIAALDLRRRPDHRSEMRSQLLLGEVVDRVRSADAAKWWLIRNRTDGYEGWVRTWGLVEATPARAARWLRAARAIISAPQVELFAATGSAVSPLFLNSRAIPGRSARGRISLELPDGRRGWVPRSAVHTGKEPMPSIAGRVRSLLGTPYLWGGRTPAGFDCSGYVQQVLAERGIAFPRDAWEQKAASVVLGSMEDLREGDLLFFGPGRGRVSHVGMALGGGYFTDCRGRVRVVGLDRNNPLYDNGLMDQLRGIGRPSGGRRFGRSPA